MVASLSGVTIYCGLKPLSTSMPKERVGKSQTWPLDASTAASLPKYFWMVFALCGDSTIMSCFILSPNCLLVSVL